MIPQYYRWLKMLVLSSLSFLAGGFCMLTGSAFLLGAWAFLCLPWAFVWKEEVYTELPILCIQCSIWWAFRVIGCPLYRIWLNNSSATHVYMTTGLLFKSEQIQTIKYRVICFGKPFITWTSMMKNQLAQPYS